MPKVRPMLAKLISEPFDKEGWLFEVKWDGYRAIAEVKKGKVELYSRQGNSFLNTYKPIVEALKKIKFDAVFDGEIVAMKDGKLSFHALQNYGQSPVPIQYVIFDLLEFRGRDLRNTPLKERKKILKKNFPKNKLLVFSDHVEKNGRKFFHLVREQGLEGMIAKDEESSYIEGQRTGSWVKVKHLNSQEAVIVGFTEPKGSRKFLGALVLAAKEGGKLRYIGHSGGGFTTAELKNLHERLNKIKRKTPPIKERISINSPITWVEPKYICQVEFTEWTPEGLMRHPKFAGLREDKETKEVVVEKAEPKISNPDKVFWPAEGYTKGDVINYYEKIAPTILPYLLDRPQSLNRHPNGIKGESFFQKNIDTKVPEFVATKEIESGSGNVTRYLLCQNKETLIYLANLGCIELNPWSSRINSLDRPDYMIIDLDPGKRSFKELVKVALETKRLLDEACETHYVKTSGKKGLHIMVPLGARYDYDTIRNFSELLVRIIHKRMPELTSIDRTPSKRGGKIYLDYLQNRWGQTIAAPYSLRPWPGATVSTPLNWSEVNSRLDPSKFNIKTLFKRLEKHGDLWDGLLDRGVDLAKSIKCLERIET